MTKELVVVAKNPAEMQEAQKGLIAWAEYKLQELRTDHDELVANYDIARQNKWRSGPWKARMLKAEKQILYYRKVKAALEEGYCLVPNFPVDVFAIRTSRDVPRKGTPQKYSHQVSNAQTESPQLGDGVYVAPEVIIETETVEKEDGKIVDWHTAGEFQDVDFPFPFAKAQILEETGKAMKKLIFDEIGCLPARRRRGDPVIVGRILRREGYRDNALTFLISWWIDTRDL